MYVLSWRTVFALTPRVLFWCLFSSLLRNSGNKHKNNTLVSTETVRHESTYIILYFEKMLTSSANGGYLSQLYHVYKVRFDLW